ncbi:pentatricopeptide repeat-containing protein At1g62350-like [Cucurbita pepo subsp. pepo]|uniref:pentatricopeptide repeat-containing protein At1g62350-like n=1 Tax=Cucurbita pepo subsp. pepo TaxID=3664 RepID=UPI000C9D4E98|nr:pentatricopeptide repeat-containing protein At1g62350-like [Cucurbita pepo subsp. pepo]
MKSTLMGRLQLHFPQLGFRQNLTNPTLHCCTAGPPPNIICGLRKGQRKPLGKSRVPSTESIQAVQSLKLAKSASKMEDVINSKLSRLLKADLFDALAELQRQNELELSLQVFKFMRNEEWYEPDLNLYHVMIQMMGKNKMIEMAEEVFHELKRDGLEPDTRAFNEMMGAYMQVDMVERAVETYELMKASGCIPDKLTFKILIKNLERFREEFAAVVKKECAEFLDSPEKFLRDVEQKLMKVQIL